MKKAILIEDRIHRQKNLLGENVIQLTKLSLLNNISGGIDFVDMQTNLNKQEYSVLDEYTVIMLHRSAFETNTRNGIIDYLKRTDKKVVFFSGGITGCQASKIGSLELLLINVNQFYSDNLILFLKNDAQNLLELAFGNNWQTSILIDAYEKLVLYVKYFTKQPWSRIEDDLKLNNLVKQDYFVELQQKSLISKSDIEEVLRNMNKDIKNLL